MMFIEAKPRHLISDIALYGVIVSVVAMIVLIVAHVLIMRDALTYNGGTPDRTLLVTLVVDFRYFFETTIQAAAIIFVGARFFEGRSFLTVGFDKLDTAKTARASVSRPRRTYMSASAVCAATSALAL